MKYTLKVGESIRNNPYFHPFHTFCPYGEGEYVALNVMEDGTLAMLFAVSDLTEEETHDFLNKNVKFFSRRLTQNVHATLIRGAFSYDGIVDANLYSDDRVDLITQKQEMVLFLVDTKDGILKGIRMCTLPQALCENLTEDMKATLNCDASGAELNEAWSTLFSQSPAILIKYSRYLGKEAMSIRTKELNIYH